jgi:hypothetical protein
MALGSEQLTDAQKPSIEREGGLETQINSECHTLAGIVRGKRVAESQVSKA